MNKKTEQFVYCILGALIGLALGFVLLSIGYAFSKEISVLIFLLMMSIFGVLFSVIFYQIKIISLFKKGNKVRDEAVTLITHEMRTGLTSTGWSLEMIMNDYGNVIKEDDKKILQGVIKSIHATIMHSVNLLDISLLDMEKLVISLENIPMSKIEITLQEIIEKYNIGAKRKNVTLKFDLKINVEKKIEIDIMRLRIILENLLENALQYTTEGGEIRISLKHTDQDMLIDVSDDGIGIPYSEQGKVFSQFYRASNARKKLSSGSGIGLYMCQKYIKAHKGSITFESKENEGTTFHIKIPLTTKMDTNQFLKDI